MCDGMMHWQSLTVLDCHLNSIWRHGQAVRHGSAKPLSPVRFRVAPPKREGHATRVLLFLVVLRTKRIALCRRRRQNPGRIRRSEIDKLACQTESERIFAAGEVRVAPPMRLDKKDDKQKTRDFLGFSSFFAVFRHFARKVRLFLKFGF